MGNVYEDFLPDVLGDMSAAYVDPTFGPTTFVKDTIPSDEDSVFEPLSSMIRDSSIYKQAYEILSADKSYGVPFLEQLKMIPESYAIRDQNFWDEFINFFGGTSGYDTALTDAFNAAMDEIRLIVQNYRTFKNGLPSEQVSQLAEAGINAAITGEGVFPSSVPESLASSLSQPNTSQSTYSNEQLSRGVSSFVEFLGSMSTLLGSGFNAASLAGMLDIAERESYNKQETHDFLLSQLGVLTDSPYRVLSPSKAPVMSTNAEAAVASSFVDAAQKVADKKAIESPISVSVGTDPNKVQHYEVKSGMDWMVEMSRFSIANRFANTMIDNINGQIKHLYAGAVSLLEGEYMMANYGAMISESEFNSDFYRNRDGVSEGLNQTNIVDSLSNIRRAEANVKAVENWMSNYRSSIIEHWGKQLADKPSLAPYFYKAMFDFDMADTFYHQSGAAQALKYGLGSLDSIGNFIGHLTGFKKPELAPRKVGSTVVSDGPKGRTVTKTTNHFE